MGGAEEVAEEEESEELILVASPWWDPDEPVSVMNMRGFLGKVRESEGNKVEVQLWRSSQRFDVEQRTYAPAWVRHDGKELCSKRRERGFSALVHEVDRSDLVGDVKGMACKRGIGILIGSPAWRYLRGLHSHNNGGEDGEAYGE